MLKVAIRNSTSLPNRNADCFKIDENHKLQLLCNNPGIEIESFLYLFESMNLTSHWIETNQTEADFIVDSMQAGVYDTYAAFKGFDRLLKHNLSYVSAGIIYETRDHLFEMI